MSEEKISGVVITFFSTASAVGKTLISINMASELARQGFRVCLVDYDLQFGDVANYLKLPVERSLVDVLEDMKANPSQDFQPELMQYRYGTITYDVLPAPEFLDEAYNIPPEGCREIIERLRLYYDYVIVDTTSMFSNLNLMMLDISTIVTFLGVVDFIPTIKNMKIGNDTLHTLNYDTNKIRLVLNRSDSKTQISMDSVEKLMGEGFYHILPNDFRGATESIASGIPLVLSGSDSVLAEEIRKLISRYTNRSYSQGSIPEKILPSAGSSHKSSGLLSKLFGR